jgi:DNA-directed RNA polymerase II subunit RPB1
MSSESQFYSEEIKRITKLEFNIFTNKEIKNYSAVSSDPFGINLPESYENYEPKKGGLVDLRLGTCDPYLNCTTCGLNYLKCPGHFGHIELAEPVFHFGFLDHLRSILQCVCTKCSNILIEKSDAQFKKALMPIAVIEEGIVILGNKLHPEKAESPIEMRVLFDKNMT